MDQSTLIDFGPYLYKSDLYIDDCNLDYYSYGDILVIDVETDERDNFVGLAFTKDGKRIDYTTNIKNDCIKVFLETGKLIGHNLKGDMKWLIKWGINIKSSQLYYDTMLASYVQNTTKEKQGLKELAKEYLGMEWPSYKDMVGKGRNKQTLDKQEVGRVAAYCGMDCLATYHLWKYFQNKLSASEKHYLETIELPTARALLDMELLGVQVDVPHLYELNEELQGRLVDLKVGVQLQWQGNEPLNINSNRQIAELLQMQGAMLPKTPKGNLKVDKQTLEQWKHLPAVPLLLEYSKIEKLKSTYTEALLEKQKEGRIFCSFNQLSKDTKGNSVGISTGRLSSSNPNLQNIPTRTEEGKLIRKAFIPEEGKVFIDADFSQIEPRLIAHFTKDRTFIDAYRNNCDIYQELVEGTGRSRQDGKTFMLALLYGAQPKKLASVFECTEKEAEQIVNQIMSKLPAVTAWVNRVKYEARQKKGVKTLFGRWIPLPKINSQDKWERLHWERVAVNSIIQGSAAEIMKLGLIKLKEVGYSTVLTCHDEYLIELDDFRDLEMDVNNIKDFLEQDLIKLEVPLKVEVGIGKSWMEAKA